MGAVLHTLNVRLYPDQLAHVIDHAGDKVIIADAVLAASLARGAQGAPLSQPRHHHRGRGRVLAR